MSIRSLTALAVARDKAAPNNPAMGGGGAAAATPAAGGASGGGAPAASDVPQQFVDVLTSSIPTEPLAAYTAIIAVATAAVDLAHPRDYLPFRWGVFAAFLVLTMLAVGIAYRRKVMGPGGPNNPESPRKFPLTEGAAALTAAAAWGLAMPGGPLDVQLSGTVRTLTTAVIIIGAAAVILLVLGPPLKVATKKPGDLPPASGPTPPTPATTTPAPANVNPANVNPADVKPTNGNPGDVNPANIKPEPALTSR